MNDREQLKRVRGVIHLLGDLGALGDCPRLRAAINEVEEQLVRCIARGGCERVEGDSPKSIAEESLRVVLEEGWSVQVVGNDVDSYMAVATLGNIIGPSAAGCTLSRALESLVKKMFPRSWAMLQTENR